ncbi:MAG: carboxymuconolactone decarboxylase family protein [Dehalococcoidia bacterium]
MARVRLNETSDLPEEHRPMFERIGQDPMGVLNIYRALSHSPEALRRFMAFGRYLLMQGKLDPKLREMAILRAGMICRSPYEVGQHIRIGRAAGLTDAQIKAIAAPHTGIFDPREMAVLAYAGEMTAAARVSDATFEAVRSFFNEEEIVELTLVTGFYNLVSRTLNALEVDVDAPAQRDLQALELDL